MYFTTSRFHDTLLELQFPSPTKELEKVRNLEVHNTCQGNMKI